MFRYFRAAIANNHRTRSPVCSLFTLNVHFRVHCVALITNLLPTAFPSILTRLAMLVLLCHCSFPEVPPLHAEVFSMDIGRRCLDVAVAHLGVAPSCATTAARFRINFNCNSLLLFHLLTFSSSFYFTLSLSLFLVFQSDGYQNMEQLHAEGEQLTEPRRTASLLSVSGKSGSSAFSLSLSDRGSFTKDLYRWLMYWLRWLRYRSD